MVAIGQARDADPVLQHIAVHQVGFLGLGCWLGPPIWDKAPMVCGVGVPGQASISLYVNPKRSVSIYIYIYMSALILLRASCILPNSMWLFCNKAIAFGLASSTLVTPWLLAGSGLFVWAAVPAESWISDHCLASLPCFCLEQRKRVVRTAIRPKAFWSTASGLAFMAFICCWTLEALLLPAGLQAGFQSLDV